MRYLFAAMLFNLNLSFKLALRFSAFGVLDIISADEGYPAVIPKKAFKDNLRN